MEYDCTASDTLNICKSGFGRKKGLIFDKNLGFEENFEKLSSENFPIIGRIFDKIFILTENLLKLTKNLQKLTRNVYAILLVSKTDFVLSSDLNQKFSNYRQDFKILVTRKTAYKWNTTVFIKLIIIIVR